MSNGFQYQLTTVLTWGRNKGRSVQWIIDNDMGWIKWAHRKGTQDPEFGFKLSRDAFEYLVEKNGRGPDHLPQTSIFKRHSNKKR